MRLFICGTCHTVEPVPEYSGSAKVDPLVEQLMTRHVEKDPMGHGGSTRQMSPFRLGGDVSDERWAVPAEREKIIEAINWDNKQNGFDAWVGESIDTFGADAMVCYQRHGRPKGGCPDWWSDSKRIGRPTAEGRHVIKENYRLGEADPHLCQFCVVSTFVTTEVNWRAGLYKET